MMKKEMPEIQGKRLIAAAVFFLCAVLLGAGFPFPAAAHSPKDVVVTYDQAKKTLEVKITHGSKDAASHYIKKVEIKQNGKSVGVTEYKSQPSPETFSYTYPLEAAAGDIIEVTGTCNIFGSKTGKLTLGK
jgi:desulfoferrodoxin (superoxide reductase-like protein)